MDADAKPATEDEEQLGIKMQSSSACSGTCPQPNFKLQRILSGHALAVASAKYSPGEGARIATAAADKTIKIWDSKSGECLSTYLGHTLGISDVAWSPSGLYLASASDDQTVKLWDTATGQCLRTLAGHTHSVVCCNFDPHGHLLASGSFDETLRVWDVRSGKCLREVPAHSDPVTAVDFVLDGTLIVTSSVDGLCRIWDTHSGHCLKTIFDQESPPITHVRFSPNGRYFLASSLDSKMRLWHYESRKAVKVYGEHLNKEYCAMSTFLSAAGGTAQPRTATAAKAAAAAAAAKPVVAPWVITGSEDGAIYIYDLNTCKVMQKLDGRASPAESGDGHCDAVLTVAAHPCEPTFVSGGHSKDCTARIWTHTAGATV